MAVKIAQITIKGITPLLMHKYPLVPLEAIEKKTMQEQAEYAAYRDEKTRKLYIPGLNVQRAFIAGATYSKGKGRATLQKPAAACFLVLPEKISLETTEYDIDSRAVVVPATKGRIVRHRPRLDDWEISFQLEWDDLLLKETEVRTIVDNTCSRVGFLDFRPEKKGPFGRGMITKWEIM